MGSLTTEILNIMVKKSECLRAVQNKEAAFLNWGLEINFAFSKQTWPQNMPFFFFKLQKAQNIFNVWNFQNGPHTCKVQKVSCWCG